VEVLLRDLKGAAASADAVAFREVVWEDTAKDDPLAVPSTLLVTKESIIDRTYYGDEGDVGSNATYPIPLFLTKRMGLGYLGIDWLPLSG